MPASSPAWIPQDMRTARILLWIQTALYAITSATYVMALAGTVNSGTTGLIGPVFVGIALLTIAATVGAGYAAAILPKGLKSTRGLIVAAEALFAVESLNKLTATDSSAETVGVLIRLALVVAVLVIVLRQGGREHFSN